MKKKKFAVWILMVLLALSMLGAVPVFAEDGETQTTVKHYNVMLVIDGSGSLVGGEGGGTDVQGYRYRALDIFLGVLTNEGNKVGAIVFNHESEMPLDTGLMDLPTMADKKNFAQRIEDIGAQGDTDIGGALLQALEELQGDQADPNLPSCILLFSDGETDLGNDPDTQASLKEKDQAIQEAQRLGIPIHGICLNTNNSANTQEVKGIADGTGGFYQEIQNAADLNDAFLKFYSLIYGEAVVDGGDEEVPFEKKFKIPSVGIVEVNIIMESESTTKKVTLTRPDGIAYSDTELEAATIKSGDYELIKIVDPDEGIWTLKVDDETGTKTKVKFDWIYNTDLSAEIECETQDVSLNTDVAIRGYLLSQGARTDSTKVYEEYSGTLILTNTATGESQNYPMESDGTSFLTNVKFQEYGTYEASIQLVCGDIVHNSDSTTINVGNEPPVAKESVIQEKITVFPFGSAKTDFDLNDYVTDPEGDELNYELGTYSYDADKVTLDGNKLKVDADSVKDGSVVVRASDSQGAVTEVTFEISVQNLTFLFVILLVIIAAAVLIVLFLKRKKEREALYRGTVTVSSFDYNSGSSSQPWPQTGIKYKKNLRDWQIVECGVQGEFVARSVRGKKDADLYFVSSQPFETEGGQIVKEYKFAVGDDIRLFAPAATEDDHMTRGIRVIVSENMDW